MVSPPHHNRRFFTTAAISLVELLVVIAILASVALIVIPHVGKFSDAAERSVAKRNAQRLASLSASIAAMGAEHVLPESLGGTEATCRQLRKGFTFTEGVSAGQYYGMPSLAEHEIPFAAVYLEIGYENLSFLQLIYLAGKEFEEEEPAVNNGNKKKKK